MVFVIFMGWRKGTLKWVLKSVKNKSRKISVTRLSVCQNISICGSSDFAKVTDYSFWYLSFKLVTAEPNGIRLMTVIKICLSTRLFNFLAKAPYLLKSNAKIFLIPWFLRAKAFHQETSSPHSPVMHYGK